MRTIKKLILSSLTLMPVASISTVAYCKLAEMAGEEQNLVLEGSTSVVHHLLMRQGTSSTTVAEAKKYLAQKTGITNEAALDQEFNHWVKILAQKGLIQKDEKMILAMTPSHF